MDLKRLRYFVAVAHTENISEAAEKLYISQPAVSKTIAILEEELGFPLFDRTGRKISLNINGRTFLKYAESSLHTLDEGIFRITNEVTGKPICIRLQSNVSNDSFLINTLHDFREKHPEVTFDIIKNYGKSRFMYDCHFYIHATGITLNRCESLPLFTEELYLGVPATHPLAKHSEISLEIVQDENFITLPETTSWYEEITGFCKQAGFTPKFLWICDANDLIIRLVAAGEGVAFLPAHSWGNIPDSIRMIRIRKPVCTRSYVISWQNDLILSPLLYELRDDLVCAGNKLSDLSIK